ncbi:hypothetical protein VTH06DRAFT_3009 [Thermothelomyces fergusii]
MTSASPRDASGPSSLDAAVSEGHSSVLVNLDILSRRGRSIGSRSQSSSVRPSPSRGPEGSLTHQATSGSVSSSVSSQSSPQPSQGDPTAPEDVLRGLLAESSEPDSAVSGAAALHGVKRPHDEETADEPLPKRDRLGEELERMSALHPPAAPAPPLSAGSSAFLTSAAVAHPAPVRGAADARLPRPAAVGTTAGTLPIRPGRQQPPRGWATARSYSATAYPRSRSLRARRVTAVRASRLTTAKLDVTPDLLSCQSQEL